MVLPKPQMRGLLKVNTKRDLIGMIITVSVASALFKIFYVDRRKQLYADFYKTYDWEASFKKMCESGYMQSCSK